MFVREMRFGLICWVWWDSAGVANLVHLWGAPSFLTLVLGGIRDNSCNTTVSLNIRQFSSGLLFHHLDSVPSWMLWQTSFKLILWGNVPHKSFDQSITFTASGQTFSKNVGHIILWTNVKGATFIHCNWFTDCMISYGISYLSSRMILG